MNYDELISGYFDGELTPKEDETLRQEMANNPDVKADFDDAVFMHYALKNDAETLKVPEDLKRNTHDLVMMRMLADKANSLPKDKILTNVNTKPNIDDKTAVSAKATIIKRWHTAMHFAASVAAVLILGFVNVSEYSIFRHLNDLYTYQNDHFDVTKINQKKQNTTNTKIVYRNIIIRETINSEEPALNQAAETGETIIDNSAESQAKIESTTPTEANPAKNEIMSMLAHNMETNSTADDNAMNANDVISNLNTSNNTNIDNIISSNDNTIYSNYEAKDEVSASNDIAVADLSNDVTATKAMQTMANALGADGLSFSKNIEDPSSWINSNKMGFYNDKGNVQLELKSFYAGRSVFNTYMNSDHMISLGFSQSIGYSLDGRNKFGVEIGSINQTSSRVEMMEVQYPQFSVGDAPLSPGPKVLLPYQRDDNINYLWGTLFYEYKFIEEGNFNLDGRINIGANSKGAMNILRLTASYKILGAINLSIGLDNRSFFVKSLTNKAAKSQFINSMSLIYGLEFYF